MTVLAVLMFCAGCGFGAYGAYRLWLAGIDRGSREAVSVRDNTDDGTTIKIVDDYGKLTEIREWGTDWGERP